MGSGDLTKKLDFSVHAASKSAQDKIKKSGSQISFISEDDSSENPEDSNKKDQQSDNNSWLPELKKKILILPHW